MMHSNVGSLKTHFVGFLCCIALTLVAYFLVVKSIITGAYGALILTMLAFAQAWVQLSVFLHWGGESKSRFSFLLFIFMFIVLAIVFLGSLWIMFNLNERMMPDM